ncbi:MAG: ATP-dependent zinc metalloprotease FtsH [Anaerolineae bacterium]|nr:ATP-dependent zinc metalloprotease FtsH [Anaerolineae bacterium]NUQ07253.1 ATP-dependent metallopeptidase FtsH/Yme1/Tma family protein [Anaerolineae bacterium]
MFPPPNNRPPDDKTPGGGNRPGGSGFDWSRYIWLIFLGALVLWSLFRLPDMVNSVSPNQPITIPYSLFYEQVTSGNVSEVVLQDATATGVFRSAVVYPPDGSPLLQQGVQQRESRTFTATLLPISDPELPQILRDNNVTIVGRITEANPILLFLLNFGPLVLLIGFLLWSTRRAQRQMGGIFGFGRTQARQYDPEKPKVTFADVAGQDAAKRELVEIVDFLKDPDKYIALGARIPRGVLLVGPPGTGKTLLARAVAGEANVPFFSIAASEFVEMFVGVGASRVRDLFGKAKSNAPAIVFIDEVDAVGRHRGAGMGGGNDEREQTLNQMLAEMDGFDQNESVIVMAATNRPDVLDPALLRPGRFDRQVTVGLPDRTGRHDMLKVHVRGKPLSDDVNLEELAKVTVGFSGADIANLANEAALHAARHNRKRITAEDFSEAFERIALGTEAPPLSNEKERRVVAYHEAGHAMVAALLPGADPVFKVTIIPRGMAAGVTAFQPEDDRRLYSKEYLLTRMVVGLGGRAAEEVAIGEITTGASNDLQQVTATAKRMVSAWGMSEAFGLLNFGDDDRQPFLGYSMAMGRSYSEETAAKVDAEVRRMVDDAYHRAVSLLKENRERLDQLAAALLQNESVDREEVLKIAGVPDDPNAEVVPVPAPDTSETLPR